LFLTNQHPGHAPGAFQPILSLFCQGLLSCWPNACVAGVLVCEKQQYCILRPFCFKRYAKNIPNMSRIPKGLQGISHINILPFFPQLINQKC